MLVSFELCSTSKTINKLQGPKDSIHAPGGCGFSLYKHGDPAGVGEGGLGDKTRDGPSHYNYDTDRQRDGGI